jgi:hypothetical protein
MTILTTIDIGAGRCPRIYAVKHLVSVPSNEFAAVAAPLLLYSTEA